MATQHAISNAEVTARILKNFNTSNQFYNPITDQFYNLNDSTNRWDTTSVDSINEVIESVFSETFIESVEEGRKRSGIFEHASHHKSNYRKIMNKLARAELDTSLIPFADCVLNLENAEVEPHRADQHITQTLPFSFSSGNSELNPKFENDYKVLRGLFSYESNVIVLNASRNYARKISKLSGDFYHRFKKMTDRSSKGINPALFGKHICEIVASYDKIPFDLLSEVYDEQKLFYKHSYKKETQSWENTCTFLISFDEITADSKHENIVREVTKFPFVTEWTPTIPVEEITQELISSILTMDVSTATRTETDVSTNSDKPSILDFLQENFVCNSEGFITKTGLTQEIDGYCEQRQIKRIKGDRKRALDTFCGCKESTNLISGSRVKVFRGLERKQDLPSAAPTVELNFDDKHVDNSQLDVETFSGALQVANKPATVQEVFGLYNNSIDNTIDNKREFERLINKSKLYTVNDDGFIIQK